eukprot:CAMPEP_0182599154 /NCGR_PEP_ID=MMETSP1324-20130603/89764_1 /TAXON_ID=236786 /ORGANISM="Florenciella sp., Strain RCC1587" /LENGTH=33 /DNA_ID= /DNA_START= /DNA_END= /DNA_ORIENTATION=
MTDAGMAPRLPSRVPMLLKSTVGVVTSLMSPVR